MKNLPPIDFPTREIYWNFLNKKVSPLSRKKSGRAAKAKAALKLIEEAIRGRQTARAKGKV